MRRSLLLILLAGCPGAGAAVTGTDGTTDTTIQGTTGTTGGQAVTDTGPTGDSGETDLPKPICPAGDVELKTQADVLAVAGCTEFPGDVRVGSAVTDLTPLAGVRRIAGTLSAGTFNSEVPATLGSFAGLEELESLGSLILEPVPVPDLLPFSALTEVTGMVSIRHLPLTTLEGLHNVTSIGSSLRVEGEELVELTGLRGLQRVGEKIDLYGLAITDLHGLENLAEVGVPGGEMGHVWLRYLSQLESLDGLQIDWHESIDFFMSDTVVSDLGAFAGTTALAEISLHDNKLLTDLAGLESLVSIGSLYLDGNGITDIGALAGLQSVGRLRIVSEPLTDLSPLTALTTLDALFISTSQFTELAPLPALRQIGHVTLDNNDKLADLGLLSGITSVESLALMNNDALVALPALSAMTEVKGDLDIRENAALASLAEVGALTTVGGRLRIFSNHALPHADALAWAAAITAGQGNKVADNKDSPPPQDPCPWLNDGECDEPVICPEFSDGYDCCHGACE